jgi:hypothetical protein
MVESDRGQPAAVGLGPAPHAAVDPAVAQGKALHVLARLAQHAAGGHPRPHQIAHRLVRRVGHPDRGQLPRPVQLGERGGIAAIGLDPIARPARDQRRRDHAAVLAQPAQQPMDAVAARAGFVAKAQPPVATLQALDQTVQRLRRARDLAKKADLAVAPGIGDRHRGGPLVHVQPDECGRFHAARLLCLRPGAGHSGATLDPGIPETGPFSSGGEHRV